MATKSTPPPTKAQRLLRLIPPLAFVIVATALAYWLLIHQQVRNPYALGAMAIFLGFPALVAIFRIPIELARLSAPETGDESDWVAKTVRDRRKRR
ncbi:MAG: hypothetical protein OER86_05695 [Phycisphaerae bacterium]|nr:hypothetical protein [Phycisphaerae bacterium]